MNTTTAATEANVTIDTIRAWARNGVVAAAKVAGRWVINTASLARRIAIGAMKSARKQAAMTALPLDSTYTITEGPSAGTDITTKVSTRTRDGVTYTTIRGLAPLLATRINAIADLGNRLHTLEVLLGASITITDEVAEFSIGSVSTRDNGRLRTTYAGTRDLPVDVVLDLGEQLRAQLASA